MDNKNENLPGALSALAESTAFFIALILVGAVASVVFVVWRCMGW